MHTLKLIAKWTLIIAAILLFDRACSPRDTSRMPPRSILLESYRMYKPATIRHAYQKLDSLRANDPYAAHKDSLAAGTPADTTQAGTGWGTALRRMDYYSKHLAQMSITEATALSLPLVVIVFAALILASLVKMRRSKTTVRLEHGAKGMDAKGRNRT